MDADAADYLRAIVMGVVQAVTEFLPISSSGHLVLAPHLLGEDSSSLTFDVGLHIGTMVAVITYFWRDWAGMANSAVRDVSRAGLDVRRWEPLSRLGLWLAVGTVPAVVVGLLFDSWIEENVRDPAFVGIALIVFGVLLGVADRWGGQALGLLDMTGRRSFLVGIAQAVALLPGVSRSGATISMARGLGFERGAAARFSFLMSAPVVFGAGLLKMTEAIRGDEVVQWGPLVVGAITSAVVGALVIRVFLVFIVRRTMLVFVWYRIALGLVVLIAVANGNL